MTGDNDTSDTSAEIVQDDLLGGEPRIKGHRIGVFHVWVHYRVGTTIEEIAEEVYPHLHLEQVEAAVAYANNHPQTMDALEREREQAAREHRRRARERKQLAVGKSCPQCGDQLVDGEELPRALVRCSACEEVHVVEQILSEER